MFDTFIQKSYSILFKLAIAPIAIAVGFLGPTTFASAQPRTTNQPFYIFTNNGLEPILLPANALPANAAPSSIRYQALPSSARTADGYDARYFYYFAIPANELTGDYRALPANALPSSAIPANALPSSALPSSYVSTVLSLAIPANALPSSALPSSALPSSALPSSAIPANAAPARSILDSLASYKPIVPEAVLPPGSFDFSVALDAMTTGTISLPELSNFGPGGRQTIEALPANGLPFVEPFDSTFPEGIHPPHMTAYTPPVPTSDCQSGNSITNGFTPSCGSVSWTGTYENPPFGSQSTGSEVATGSGDPCEWPVTDYKVVAGGPNDPSQIFNISTKSSYGFYPTEYVLDVGSSSPFACQTFTYSMQICSGPHFPLGTSKVTVTLYPKGETCKLVTQTLYLETSASSNPPSGPTPSGGDAHACPPGEEWCPLWNDCSTPGWCK